jgi:iron complex outermembrane receptor protein
LTVTADYHSIKVKDLIVTPNCSGALRQYYANYGVANVPGCATTADSPDPIAPNALPRLGNITSSFTNANALKSREFNFTVNARFPLVSDIRLTSVFNATLLTYLARDNVDGATQRYDGTLGPCG